MGPEDSPYLQSLRALARELEQLLADVPGLAMPAWVEEILAAEGHSPEGAAGPGGPAGARPRRIQ